VDRGLETAAIAGGVLFLLVATGGLLAFLYDRPLLALGGGLPIAVPLGGAHVTAQALIRALVRRGGRYQVLKTVRRVLVENGAAVGVELADGTAIRARAVVSSGGLQQTLLDLVGEAALEPGLAARVRGFQLDEYALFGVHLALARAPDYPLADRRDVARASAELAERRVDGRDDRVAHGVRVEGRRTGGIRRDAIRDPRRRAGDLTRVGIERDRARGRRAHVDRQRERRASLPLRDLPAFRRHRSEA
jgi:hypothetical protein